MPAAKQQNDRVFQLVMNTLMIDGLVSVYLPATEEICSLRDISPDAATHRFEITIYKRNYIRHLPSVADAFKACEELIRLAGVQAVLKALDTKGTL
jgi:hypothetical protein